mgnify:FL=1
MGKRKIIISTLSMLASLASMAQSPQLEQAVPQATIQKLIFKEDFGEFDLSDATGSTYKVWDYSDLLNPVQLTKTTTTPFRYKLDEDPLGCNFKERGPLADGEYTVAGVLTGYNGNYEDMKGAELEWSADLHGIKLQQGFHYDHSGKPEGCALLVNCKDKTAGQAIYSRVISGLCTNRQYSAEGCMSIFTSSASGPYEPADVTLRVTEIGNESNVAEARATQTIPSVGGTGNWKMMSCRIALMKGDAVKIEVINNCNTDENGNDLVLDDIALYAFNYPAPHASLSYDTLHPNCIDGSPLILYNINVEPLTVLDKVLERGVCYLYQYSKDGMTWENIENEPQRDTSCFFDPKKFFEVDVDTQYFRVIAGSPSDLSTIEANEFNPNDLCAAYSVSNIITAEPWIDYEKHVTLVSSADTVCVGDTVVISVENPYSNPIDYTWSVVKRFHLTIDPIIDPTIDPEIFPENNIVKTPMPMYVEKAVLESSIDKCVFVADEVGIYNVTYSLLPFLGTIHVVATDCDPGTSVESTMAYAPVGIYSAYGKVYVDGVENFRIFNLMGADVTTQNGALENGVYIVSFGGNTYKVVVD